MDPATVGPQSKQARNDGVAEVILAGDEQHLARRRWGVIQAEGGQSPSNRSGQRQGQHRLAVTTVASEQRHLADRVTVQPVGSSEGVGSPARCATNASYR